MVHLEDIISYLRSIGLAKEAQELEELGNEILEERKAQKELSTQS